LDHPVDTRNDVLRTCRTHIEMLMLVLIIITSAEEGGYVFIWSVCLSVCLFVCLSVG